jgi:hypothetical protein
MGRNNGAFTTADLFLNTVIFAVNLGEYRDRKSDGYKKGKYGSALSKLHMNCFPEFTGLKAKKQGKLYYG